MTFSVERPLPPIPKMIETRRQRDRSCRTNGLETVEAEEKVVDGRHLNVRVAIKTASANNHYGILGQPAPELKLNKWIDGDGKDIAPIYLRDYQSKVIYLYFFQDW